jgi:hypothetical protein
VLRWSFCALCELCVCMCWGDLFVHCVSCVCMCWGDLFVHCVGCVCMCWGDLFVHCVSCVCMCWGDLFVHCVSCVCMCWGLLCTVWVVCVCVGVMYTVWVVSLSFLFCLRHSLISFNKNLMAYSRTAKRRQNFQTEIWIGEKNQALGIHIS